MNDYFAFGLSILIIYRISLVITIEDGPFDIFSKWRQLTTEAWGSYHWITNGFHCPLCIGFWFSFIPPIFFADSFVQWFVYSLAIAGGQTLLTLIGGIPDE